MAGNPGGLFRSNKELLAKLAVAIIAVILLAMTAGVLFLSYLLFSILTTPLQGAVGEVGVVLVIPYIMVGFIAYAVFSYVGIWLIGRLRNYYNSAEK